MTDIGEQFAMMNEISGLLSQRTLIGLLRKLRMKLKKIMTPIR